MGAGEPVAVGAMVDGVVVDGAVAVVGGVVGSGGGADCGGGALDTRSAGGDGGVEAGVRARCWAGICGMASRRSRLRGGRDV